MRDFKKVYDSVKREMLYSILIEFGVPMKLVRLIKMCLNEVYNKVLIGRYLFDNFPVQNCLKEGDAVFINNTRRWTNSRFTHPKCDIYILSPETLGSNLFCIKLLSHITLIISQINYRSKLNKLRSV
jgi:hypothetical protein